MPPRRGRKILGNLNFSSGTADPRFCKTSIAFRGDRCLPGRVEPTWKAMHRFLAKALQDLHGQGEAFRQVDQAEAVLGLVFEKTLPGYRQFHADLLFHQSEESLFQPLFVGRVWKPCCSRAGPGTKPTASSAERSPNSTITSATGPWPCSARSRKSSPMPTNGCGRSPCSFAGRGGGVGRYHDLIARALTILEGVDSSLQFEAMFDPALLEELAVDPRAYDFDHPVNKRPNYLFGQWDLGKLDNAGRCRHRFVPCGRCGWTS